MIFTVCAGELLVFKHHNHMAGELEHQVHARLIFLIGCSALSTLLEYKYPHSLPSSLSTTFFMFLQGSWFIQVGFILYPPGPGWLPYFSPSNTDEPIDQLILADLIFIAHAAADLLLLLCLYVGINKLLDAVCQPGQFDAADRLLVERCVSDVIAASSVTSVSGCSKAYGCDDVGLSRYTTSQYGARCYHDFDEKDPE